MKLGIGGVLTFKNGGLDRFIDQIDLSHLVLETDAPYLAPVPYRGKRNTSAYLPLVAEKLALLTGKSLEDIAAQKITVLPKIQGLYLGSKTQGSDLTLKYCFLNVLYIA